MAALKSHRFWQRFNSVRWHLVFVISLTLFVYLPILDNEFIGDDRDFIENWSLIRDVGNWSELIQGAAPEVHLGTYRPGRGLLYLIYFQIFGTDTLGYHLHSILVHLLVTVLVYLVTKELTDNKKLSFITSLIFGIHPIHLEAISFITASMDSTSFVFLLSSFWLYLCTQKRYDRKLFYASLCLFGLAAAFNEQTYVYPVVLMGHQWIFNAKSTWRAWLKSTRGYWGISLAFIIIRFGVFGIASRSEYLGGSLITSAQLSLRAIGYYLYLLVWPVHLGLIHVLPGGISTYMFQDLLYEPVRRLSWFAPISLAVIAGLILLSWLMIKIKSTSPLISFAWIWFLVFLLPVLNLLPSAVALSERYVYLSSVAFCWGLSYGLAKLTSQRYLKFFGVASIVVVLVAYASLSLYYQQFWQDELVYWQKSVREHPTNFLAQFQLGQVYHLRYLIDDAIEHYQRAIELQPDYMKSYHNLGMLYQYLHQYEQANQQYLQVLRKYPDSSVTQSFLGSSYQSWGTELLMRGETTMAIETLIIAYTYWPSPELRSQLEYLCSQSRESSCQQLAL